MENKRPYGRRKTDENRQTQPKTRRPYEKDEREKRPVRKTFTGKPTTGRPFTDKPRNYSPKPKKKAEAAEDDGLVRLNKFIANSGITER